MDSDVEAPMSPLREDDDKRRANAKPVPAKHIPMGMIVRQFGLRKVLQHRLLLSDIMCFLGLLGVILMVIGNELTFRTNDNIRMDIRWLIKLLISLSTVVLIVLMLFYHYSDFRLHATQNSLDDWRMRLTLRRIFLIIFEILICAIHPIPQSFPLNGFSKYQTNTTISMKLSSPNSFYMATDVALGLPMFARLYLICRCIKFHSPLVRDAPSKSLGSFNQISINFLFLLKTYLVQWPARSLITSCCLMFFIGSWSIRACDYKPTAEKPISLFDSMWLFIITFTTVGYGDLTPSTYCGRTVVSVIALFGLLSSALLISVAAQKLQLSRWEKYVHNFASEIDLRRQRRAQAANVIKFALKVWYIQRRQNRGRSLPRFQTQRSLRQSIDAQRKIRQEQRKLQENSLDFVQSIEIQRYTSLKTKRIARDLTALSSNLERQLADLNTTLRNVQNRLDLLALNK